MEVLLRRLKRTAVHDYSEVGSGKLHKGQYHDLDQRSSQLGDIMVSSMLPNKLPRTFNETHVIHFFSRNLNPNNRSPQ